MDKTPLTLEIGEKIVRWTYGLQLDLQRLLPDAHNMVQAVVTDPYLRDYALRRVLTDHKGSVKDETQLVPIEEIELVPEDILKVLDWVAGHLIDFFVNSASLMTARGESLLRALPSSHSNSGSETSASRTESAGPSGSVKAT